MKVGTIFRKPSPDFFDFHNVMELPEKAALAWISSVVSGFRHIEVNTAVVVKAQLKDHAVAIARRENGTYAITQTHFVLTHTHLSG